MEPKATSAGEPGTAPPGPGERMAPPNPPNNGGELAAAAAAASSNGGPGGQDFVVVARREEVPPDLADAGVTAAALSPGRPQLAH